MFSTSVQFNDFFFAHGIITSFLTGYEAHQLYSTCKSVCESLDEEDVWLGIILRDYPLVLVDDNAKELLLGLEYGISCGFCADSEYAVCRHHCQGQINKGICMKVYRLSACEILRLPCFVSCLEIDDIELFKSYCYSALNVRKFTMKKNQGYTNFKNNFVMKSLRAQRQKQARLDAKAEVESRVDRWLRAVVDPSLNAASKSSRQHRLSKALRAYNLGIPPRSTLAKNFTTGSYDLHRTVSAEHAAAILALADALFSYSHIAYSKLHEECKQKLAYYMYIHRKKSRYTWETALKAVLHNMKHRLAFYAPLDPMVDINQVD